MAGGGRTGGTQGLVIVGGTGDLAQRMLFPSLMYLEQEKLLPEGLKVVSTGRSADGRDAFAAATAERMCSRLKGAFEEAAWARFTQRLEVQPLDANDPKDFQALAKTLGPVDDAVFYLSTSPALYGALCAGLAGAGLAQAPNRVVLEKPIGKNLESSRATNDAVAAAFSEDRTFRIDHYLGKETVQNLLALRFANAAFEPLWNAHAIDHVQITIAETVGVEGRGAYYDAYGAIGDMVQNHLLQLLCLIAMEPPASLDPDSVRNEKVKVLRSLRPITAADVEHTTVRGQYRAGVADGASVNGYLEESNGGEGKAETFVAIRAHVDNWRWAGVPFYLRTGKRLPDRRTQIVIQFRAVPHSIFPGATAAPNRLVIELQPREQISLHIMNSAPGLARDGVHLRNVALNLSLTDAFKDEAPRRRIAYERLLLDALDGVPTLFVRRDEIEAAWTWIDGVTEAWRERGVTPKPYSAGTWGPAGAFALVERFGHAWYE